MVVSPRTQAGIHAVLICVNPCPWINGVFDERLDGFLLHIGQQIDHDLTATLHHPKDGWSFLLQGPASTFALEPAAASFAALVLHHLRLAFLAGNHIRFSALDFVSQPHWGLFF